jgi:hypothetical protein
MAIKFDKRNYRKHNDKNKDLIKKSLEECGAGRSIVIDNEDNIIAGNGIYEQAQKLGIKTKVIETDGSELVVVKRTDLATEDEKRKQLAVMDNSTSDSSEFDLGLLQEDFDIDQLQDWGIDANEKLISKYTRKISVPIYEITGEEPTIKEMLDTSRADKLISKINALNIDKNIKEFLLKTATRLYEFRYDKIAEFYAHQDEQIKDVMEELALVIIDFKKGIEQGYIELNNFIEECFLSENNIDA